jgi:serine/threonine protein kinase
LIGELIGNFRIVAQVGRGGMGEVFRAEQTNVGTRVAIKMLSAEMSADGEYVQRLFNEARAVSRIRHPGVVQIFDVGTTGQGRAFLIMELLEGETLRQALVRGRMHATRVAELGRQLASVLEATHAVGITHRDLKPDNIFLVPDAQVAGGTRVKVLDFGIAKLTGTLHAQSPRTYGTMGTPAYMAPEQWGDPKAIDHRADQYSLGCVMFEMVAGRPPFLVTTMAEACNAHIHQQPPRARSIAADVPPALDELLARLLLKGPEQRAPIPEVMATLGSLVQPIDPHRTQDTALPRPARIDAQPTQDTAQAASPKRKSRVPLLVAALLALLAVTGIVIAVKSTSPSAKSAPPTDEVTGGAAKPTAGKPADAVFLDWLEQTNPWHTYNGVPAQMYGVRRREYLNWVDTLPAEERAWAKPLFRAAVDGIDASINWITFEQAERYCKAIGAKLISNDQWERAVTNDIGVNPGGLRVWTSTKTDKGLAIVRGSFTEMQPDAIKAEKPWRRERDSEATAGGRDPIERVASKEIGAWCAR